MFIPTGEKSISCGNSGNIPGGDSTRVSPGGDNARVSPLVEIHRRFFPFGNSGNKRSVRLACVSGIMCPKFEVTYIPASNPKPDRLGNFFEYSMRSS